MSVYVAMYCALYVCLYVCLNICTACFVTYVAICVRNVYACSYVVQMYVVHMYRSVCVYRCS